MLLKFVYYDAIVSKQDVVIIYNKR